MYMIPQAAYRARLASSMFFLSVNPPEQVLQVKIFHETALDVVEVVICSSRGPEKSTL